MPWLESLFQLGVMLTIAKYVLSFRSELDRRVRCRSMPSKLRQYDAWYPNLGMLAKTSVMQGNGPSFGGRGTTGSNPVQGPASSFLALLLWPWTALIFNRFQLLASQPDPPGWHHPWQNRRSRTSPCGCGKSPPRSSDCQSVPPFGECLVKLRKVNASIIGVEVQVGNATVVGPSPQHEGHHLPKRF